MEESLKLKRTKDNCRFPIMSLEGTSIMSIAKFVITFNVICSSDY